MYMWRFLRLLMFGIYGVLAPSWFGWGFDNPKFWAMMLVMVLACVFASEEEAKSLTK